MTLRPTLRSMRCIAGGISVVVLVLALNVHDVDAERKKKRRQRRQTSTVKDLAPGEVSSVETTGIGVHDIDSMVDQLWRDIAAKLQIVDGLVLNTNNPGEVHGKPRITIRPMDNFTTERLDPELITIRIRTHLVRNARGQVEFIARNIDRGQSRIREDVLAEQRMRDLGVVESSPNQPQKTADYFLTGNIREFLHVGPTGRERQLVFTFELIDTQTSSLMWVDEYVIRKAAVLSNSYRGKDKR